MSRESQQEDITKKTLVSRIPGMEDVSVRRNIAYRGSGDASFVLDVYAPPSVHAEERHPAVLLVAGYPDPGYEARLGCKFKDMGSSTSWARLIAASGLAAITYANRDPAADVHAVLAYLRENGASLGIDAGRLGLWAGSGNVPTALSLLMTRESGLRCGVLCYGFMLDPDGSTGVEEEAKRWGFSYPCAGKSVDDVPRDLPLLIVRAGGDTFPRLNPSIDAFVLHGLARNLPLTLVNYPDGHHAFDVFDDTEASRAILGQLVGFARFHLAA